MSKKFVSRFLICELVTVNGNEFFQVIYMSDLQSVYLIPVSQFDASRKAYTYSEFKIGKGILAYLV